MPPGATSQECVVFAFQLGSSRRALATDGGAAHRALEEEEGGTGPELPVVAAGNCTLDAEICALTPEELRRIIKSFLGEMLDYAIDYATDDAVQVTLSNGTGVVRVSGSCAELAPLLQDVKGALEQW
eukprot:7011997-Prymnesium_polylepis.1